VPATTSRPRVHAIEGAVDGPTVGIVAGVNGDELASVRAARAVLGDLVADRLRGRVLMLPVAHPAGVRAVSRTSPDDGLLLSRAFPGRSDGSATERLADAVTDALLPACDVLIQLHSANEQFVVDFVYASRLRPELAHAFGTRVVARAAPPPGTLAALAEERGVPAVIVELGGGRTWAERYAGLALQGVRRVLAELGMLDGVADDGPPQVEVTELSFLTAPAGGILAPHVGIASLGHELEAGVALATITDPSSAAPVGVVEADLARPILLMAPERDTRVEPGELTFILADAATATAIDRTNHAPSTMGEE
jgi:predicted deacylase